MLKITSIEKYSISDELGIEVGSKLIEFNGKPVLDILDYIYYDSKDSFVMSIEELSGEIVDFEIEKDEFETLGLTFEKEGELKTTCCRNNCIFCFVSQLPRGMRKTLYVKDDDWRLSVISGNYVTLTNLTEKDMQRIVKMKMSPLYISVHTTNGELRKKMLNNTNADKIMSQLETFSNCGIKMHCQIVLCPNVNDGDELKNSLQDLSKIKGIQTVAIVPVGLTVHRQGLAVLEQVDKTVAENAIKICDEINNKLNKSFAFCSDEVYIKAKREMPEFEYYGNFEQIENGVGLFAKFENEFDEALRSSPKEVGTCNRTVAIVTGVSSYEFILDKAKRLEGKYSNQGLKIDVYKGINYYFGETITVTGLLTGKDILNTLKTAKKFDMLVVPKVMLKEFENVFLDGKTVEELSDDLETKVRVIESDGESFVNGIIS